MRGARLSLGVDETYSAALGLAVYAFAALEWNAIRCCERIRPGQLATLDERTAGSVADTLRGLASRLADDRGSAELERAAADFQALVRSRNNLLHAKPSAAADGTPRLMRDGDLWQLHEIEAVADAFAACAARLEACLDRL